MKKTVVLFGAGYMGSAIAHGIQKNGGFALRVIDTNINKLQEFSARGIPAEFICSSLTASDVLILAVPPQAFKSFALENRLIHFHPGLVISVMAGICISSIRQMLGTQNIVRSIPNTPSAVSEGMTVYCRSPSVDDRHAQQALEVFEMFGHAVEVSDEALIDPATALCGGGPAFVAYFAAALQEFGIKSGISKDDALAITIQLLRGISKLLTTSGKTPMQLCREVMTPDGTTEHGIWHFDKENFSNTVIEALAKASARSRELGLIYKKTLFNLEAIK